MKAALLVAVVVVSLFVTGCPAPEAPDVGDGLLTAKWFVDRGAPDETLGVDGDLYLDQDSMMVYVKTGGAWVSVASLRGDAGAGWLYGSGAPSGSLGSDGDLYLDIVSTIAYRKESGVWTPLFSLQGEAGTQWFSGEGHPGDADPPIVAAVGDLYLDTLTAMIYERASGGWVTSASLRIGVPQYVFTPLTLHTLMGVGYGGGTFVAVGDGYGVPGVAMVSYDGTDWELASGYHLPMRISGPRPDLVKGWVTNEYNGYMENVLTDVAWGGGTFVAVGLGQFGVCYATSDDGSSWQPGAEDLSDSGHLDGISYLNGKFVALGWSGSSGPGIWTSESGDIWIQGNINGEPSGTESYQGCAWGGVGESAVYVAVGNEGTILTSAEATQWYPASYSFPLIGSLQFSGIAYANGCFVAVGQDLNLGCPVIVRSPNGDDWSTQDLPYGTLGSLVGIAAGNGGLVAVGNDGGGGMMVLKSPNGYTWSVDRWAGETSGVGYGDFDGGLWVVTGPPGELIE